MATTSMTVLGPNPVSVYDAGFAHDGNGTTLVVAVVDTGGGVNERCLLKREPADSDWSIIADFTPGAFPPGAEAYFAAGRWFCARDVAGGSTELRTSSDLTTWTTVHTEAYDIRVDSVVTDGTTAYLLLNRGSSNFKIIRVVNGATADVVDTATPMGAATNAPSNDGQLIAGDGTVLWLSACWHETYGGDGAVVHLISGLDASVAEYDFRGIAEPRQMVVPRNTALPLYILDAGSEYGSVPAGRIYRRAAGAWSDTTVSYGLIADTYRERGVYANGYLFTQDNNNPPTIQVLDIDTGVAYSLDVEAELVIMENQASTFVDGTAGIVVAKDSSGNVGYLDPVSIVAGMNPAPELRMWTVTGTFTNVPPGLDVNYQEAVLYTENNNTDYLSFNYAESYDFVSSGIAALGSEKAWIAFDVSANRPGGDTYTAVKAVFGPYTMSEIGTLEV